MRPQFAVPYQFMLGDEILMAPFYKESSDNTRTVYFPPGEWIYMFDESKVYGVGIKKLHFPYEEAPVFIRNGAIIPMDSLEDGFTNVRIYPTRGSNSFGLYEEGVKGAMISYTLDRDNTLTLKTDPTARELLFRVRGYAPTSVTMGGTQLTRASSMAELKAMDSGWFVQEGNVYVAMKNAQAGVEIILK